MSSSEYCVVSIEEKRTYDTEYCFKVLCHAYVFYVEKELEKMVQRVRGYNIPSDVIVPLDNTINILNDSLFQMARNYFIQYDPMFRMLKSIPVLYQFDENRSTFRDSFINTAFEIFAHYESQIMCSITDTSEPEKILIDLGRNVAEGTLSFMINSNGEVDLRECTQETVKYFDDSAGPIKYIFRKILHLFAEDVASFSNFNKCTGIRIKNGETVSYMKRELDKEPTLGYRILFSWDGFEVYESYPITGRNAKECRYEFINLSDGDKVNLKSRVLQSIISHHHNETLINEALRDNWYTITEEQSLRTLPLKKLLEALIRLFVLGTNKLLTLVTSMGKPDIRHALFKIDMSFPKRLNPKFDTLAQNIRAFMDEGIENRIFNILEYRKENVSKFNEELVKGAYSVFCAYERQFRFFPFLKFVEYVAVDAIYRFMRYLIGKSIVEINSNIVEEGIVTGSTHVAIKYTVNDIITISIDDFFKRVGLCDIDGLVRIYYKKELSSNPLLHYRLKLWFDNMLEYSLVTDPVIDTYQYINIEESTNVEYLCQYLHILNRNFKSTSI